MGGGVTDLESVEESVADSVGVEICVTVAELVADLAYDTETVSDLTLVAVGVRVGGGVRVVVLVKLSAVVGVGVGGGVMVEVAEDVIEVEIVRDPLVVLERVRKSVTEADAERVSECSL